MASTTRSSSPQDRVQSSQQPKSSSIHLSSARKTPPKSSLKTHSRTIFFVPRCFSMSYISIFASRSIETDGDPSIIEPALHVDESSNNEVSNHASTAAHIRDAAPYFAGPLPHSPTVSLQRHILQARCHILSRWRCSTVFCRPAATFLRWRYSTVFCKPAATFPRWHYTAVFCKPAAFSSCQAWYDRLCHVG